MAANDRKLKITVEGDRSFLMERAFDAPRHLVWEAMSKPEYVRHWWCCDYEGFNMSACEIDFRVGGKWRYGMKSPDGGETFFYGEYREIEKPSRVVQTEFFSMFPEEETVCTMTLEERDGRTYYKNRVVHQTPEGMQGHLASGMEHGAASSLDRLEQVALSRVQGGASSKGAHVDTPAPTTR